MAKFNDVLIGALKRRTGGKLTNDLIANALLERSELIDTLIDPRRDIDAECHYPSTGEITADQLKNMYDRDPIACRVVQCLAKQSWQVQPSVYEVEDPEIKTAFEEAWDSLQPMVSGKSWYKSEEAGSIWEYLIRADILSGIGHFGVLLMGFDDGKDLQEPVEGAMITNDCYLTKTEEDNLYKLPGLNDQEKTVLNSLARQREFVLNYMQAQEDKKYQQQEKKQGTALFGDISSLSTDSSTPADDDKQFSQGFGLKGEAEYKPSPMGTDQQYFGVQFGPSEQPATEATNKKKLKLLFLRPFDESLVQIVRYEWNINNPRFGMPVMYRITLNDPREQHSGVGLPMATVFVHWSRVIHLADNLNSSEIFGTPRCRPVFNRLLDLQKIYGASAEGYWQAAFTGLALETHPQLGGDVTIDSDDVRDQIENYINSLQRYLALTGMSAHTLAPQVSDPSNQIDKHLEAICIQLEIPKRVFMGSERGELASSQDDASWNDRLKARQQGYITPRIIVPFVDRLIAVGVLPEPDYVEPEEPEEEDEFSEEDTFGAGGGGYLPDEFEGEEEDLEQPSSIDNQPVEKLNGAQIEAALELMFRVSEGEIAPEAAVELLIGIGISQERANRMINSQSTLKKVIASDNPEATLQKIDVQAQLEEPKEELEGEEEDDRSPAALIKNTRVKLPLGAKWVQGRVGEIYQYNSKIFKVKNPVINAFCPTGEGGGKDNSCSSSEGGSNESGDSSSDIPEVEELDKALNAGVEKYKFPKILYHVTSGKAVKGIDKSGLKFGHKRATTSGKNRGVYLTDSPEELFGAEDFDPKDVHIVEVDTSKLKLRFDPEFYYGTLQEDTPEELHRSIKDGEAGVFAYSKTSIPRSAIKSIKPARIDKLGWSYKDKQTRNAQQTSINNAIEEEEKNEPPKEKRDLKRYTTIEDEEEESMVAEGEEEKIEEEDYPLEGDLEQEELEEVDPLLEDDTIEQIGVKTPKGYCVVWPDLESNTDLSKAQIAATKTQAMATYVGGNVESIMPLIHFYTKILGLSDEEAADLVKAAEEQEAEMAMEQQMQNPFGGGQPPFGQQPPMPGQQPPPPFGQEPGQFPPTEEETFLEEEEIEEGEPTNPFNQTENVFCATGEGGGVDPSCGGGEEGGQSKSTSSKQTGTPEFKKWFGKSKVVDKQGAPLRVYHGTKASIEQFDEGKIGSATGNTGWFGKGFYMSASAEDASHYAEMGSSTGEGANIVPVYVSIEKPFVVHMTEESQPRGDTNTYMSEEAKITVRELEGWTDEERSIIEDALPDYSDSQQELFPWTDDNPTIPPSRFTEVLKKNGYDGVIVHSHTITYDTDGKTGDYDYDNPIEKTQEYSEIVAFYPHQIKSATGNRGKFDPKDPIITHSSK
jgi:hypothetical protein